MNTVQTRRRTQEVEDTYRRALIGGLLYLAAWMVVGNYGGAFSRAPTISWLLVVAFTALVMSVYLIYVVISLLRSHADGLYRAADRAVYRAKSAGRNCLCQDEPILA